MHIAEFLVESKKTLAPTEKFKRDDFRMNLLYGSSIVATEAGEILDHMQRIVFRGQELDREHVKEEIGDLMYGVGVLLRNLNIDFEEDILQFQIDKNQQIYGEDGYDSYKNGLRKSVPYLTGGATPISKFAELGTL